MSIRHCSQQSWWKAGALLRKVRRHDDDDVFRVASSPLMCEVSSVAELSCSDDDREFEVEPELCPPCCFDHLTEEGLHPCFCSDGDAASLQSWNQPTSTPRRRSPQQCWSPTPSL